MRFSARCIGAVALPALLTAAATLPVGAATVQPGDLAPDFTLLDAGATSHTLSDYRGDQAISREDAETYLAQAQRFLEEVRRMLGSIP